MAYYLRSSNCSLAASGDTGLVNINLTTSKGIKNVSFKLSIPSTERNYFIKSYTPPVWAKECIITNTPYGELYNGVEVYYEMVVTLTVKEESTLYIGPTGSSTLLTIHAGAFSISNITQDSTPLRVYAVEQLFSGQINKCAIVFTDGTTRAVNEVSSFNGTLTVGSITAVVVTGITTNKSSAATNEEVTFTAQYTGSLATFVWELGGTATVVGNGNESSIVVKYTSPGVFTPTVTATNAGGSSRVSADRLITVNGASTPSSGQTVTITPNNESFWERLNTSYAPVTERFYGTYTGLPVKVWFEIRGYDEELITSFINVNEIEYVFINPGVYSVTFKAEYADGVVKYAKCDWNILSVAPVFDSIVITPSSTNAPSNVTIDATNVIGRTSIARYVWEIAKDGVFYTDTTPITIDKATKIPFPGMSYPYFDSNPSHLVLPETETISYAFYVPGIYSMRLHAWTDLSGDGYVTKTFRNVAVVGQSHAPVPDFSSSSTLTGNAPLVVEFDPGFIMNSDYERWDYGDGSWANITDRENTKAIRVYRTPGIYDVKLTCYNSTYAPSGVSITKTAYVTVFDPVVPAPVLKVVGMVPDVNYGAYVLKESPYQITFETSQSNNCTSIELYKDGGILVDTIYPPFANKAYTVTEDTHFYVIGKKSGASQTYTPSWYVKVFTKPQATISVDGETDPIEITAGTTLNFLGTTEDEVETWFWNFGDGATSSLQNPSHTYLSDGIYTVTLTVSNQAGSNTVTKTNYITVGTGDAFDGDITADATVFIFPSNPTADANFTFTGTYSTDYTYLWEFGDGQTALGTSTEITHRYTKYGEFPVSLTITSKTTGANRKIIKDRFILVKVSHTPIADFEVVQEKTSSNGTCVVTVYPRSTGAVASHFMINFGDNATFQRYDNVPNLIIQHTYTGFGKYTITLQAFNEYGSNEAKKVDCVNVSITSLPYPLMQVTPSYDSSTPLRGSVPLTVKFIDATPENTTESIISWRWDFGNGDVSLQKNPTYTYNYPGVYYVTLKVGTARGLEYFSSVTLTIEAKQRKDAVMENVDPDFGTSYTTGVAPFTTRFYSSSKGQPTAYAWLFGDEPAGTQFPTLDPSKAVVDHTYTHSGVYTVRMKCENELGDAIKTKNNYIVVSDPAPDVVSDVLCNINTIGDIYIPTISEITPSGQNEVKRVENKNTLHSYAYSIPSIIETLGVSGYLYTDGKTEDEYAEDVESVRFRSGAYNYIDVAGKRGFLEIQSVDIPKNADTQTMRNYSLDCNFMSATMFERAYTMETSLSNPVINGARYTVDHPPTVSLPVNAFNVKIKSPWQTVAMKEVTYQMNSSEGKIPIYMPFKLYTSEDTSFKTYGNVSVNRTLFQYGYGKIILGPKESSSAGVTWDAKIGVDVPLGKYKIAMKLGVRKINDSPQNVPESCVFDCTGYNLTDSSLRVVSSPPVQRINVTYDGIYYTEELDVTGRHEKLEMHIINPRSDANLEIEYIYLVPTYNARVAFDAPTEYYAGETKVYDFVDGVAKRVYNVNHEFKGMIYISNPFMRWIIDPKKPWYSSGDITHTKYVRDPTKPTREYEINDELNNGMKLVPYAFHSTYPNIVIKKILPNVVELEISCENGNADAGADNARMVTTVHVVPYAFKFYVQCIGEFKYHWTLDNKFDDATFHYFYGNVMCRYGHDNVDNGTGDYGLNIATVPSFITNHQNYLYMVSFHDYIETYFDTIRLNTLFPFNNTKGNYQFTLNVFPMYTDKGYDYSDDLLCTNESMQREMNSSISEKEIDITEQVGDDTDAFWNIFEPLDDSKKDDVVINADNFVVSHTNNYAKNYTIKQYAIQNREVEYFKMDFDVSMVRPDALYVPSLNIKFMESRDRATYQYATIDGRTTDNVHLGIVGPNVNYSRARNSATVSLNMLSGGVDHITIEVIHNDSINVYHNKFYVNGVLVLQLSHQLRDGPSPIIMQFGMMYGCSFTIKDLKIRPYLVSTQTFENDEMTKRYSVFKSSTNDVVTLTYLSKAGMQLSNNGSVILKSYKMLSGTYRFKVIKPNANATTLTVYLNTEVDSDGSYNSLYLEIPSAGGTSSLKRSYEDGTIETLHSVSSPALAVDAEYELFVTLDETTRNFSMYMNAVNNYLVKIIKMDLTLSQIHFKYGKLGFKSSSGAIIVIDYGFHGIEKFGRGPQVMKYMDDFDFGVDLLAKEYNDMSPIQFIHDPVTGTVIDEEDPSANTFRILYPNCLKPQLTKTRVVIKSTKTTTAMKRAGVFTNVTGFTANQTPYGGYGAFINFDTKQLEVVTFDYDPEHSTTPTTLFTSLPGIVVIDDNRLYELTVERTLGAFYITLADFEGKSQSFIVPLGISGVNTYNEDGYTGLLTMNGVGQSGIMFDDFTIENITYKNTETSFVSMGGVSHGGEYDTQMKVYDKVFPGYSIPYGYYYLTANANSTCDNTPINYTIKDFKTDATIINAAYDGGSISGVSFTEMINKRPDQFARYVIKLDSASENHECGIEITTPSDANEYIPLTFINFIIMIPLSGGFGKQIFLHEMEIINRSPTIMYRRLEEKKIS